MDLRRAKGLTHRGLAKILGVSHVTVLHWEQGKRSPRQDMIYGPLAAALGSEVVLRFEAEWRTRGAERMVG